MPSPRRFPPPWSVEELNACFVAACSLMWLTGSDWVQSSWRFRSRRCMNFANAIRPKTNRHSTTNRTMLFVGVGRFSGKRAVGSIGDVLTVARNVLNRRRLSPVRSSLNKFCDTASDRLRRKSLWLGSFADIAPRTCSLAPCIAPNAGYSAQPQS
jgi:hypothetical protein